MDIEEKQESGGVAPPRCDNCDEAAALLYCRADSARLCFACDRQVHSANKLFSNHTRSQLCLSCLSSPASIFCSTDSSLLCHDCDWSSHLPHNLSSAAPHPRRPLEGFSGCPSASDFLALFGFDDLDKKSLLALDAFDCDDFLVVDFDDVLVDDSDSRFQALCVPPLPKNRNAVCGKNKDEVLRQLRELARKELDSVLESVSGFDALVPQRCVDPGAHDDDDHADTFHRFEGQPCLWFDEHVLGQECVPKMLGIRVEEGGRDSEKHSDTVGDCLNNANVDHPTEQSRHPLDTKASASLQKVAPYELSSQERETAISRYKEKRKVRRFDKHIRYESRKVRAESRSRVKGRFAKIEH